MMRPTCVQQKYNAPTESIAAPNPTWATSHFSVLTRSVRGRHGGAEKKRGVENLTNDTPPKKGFWTPPRTVRFPPPSGVSALFSCTKIHDRVDQKLFWRGPKIFGRARSLVRFPPPIRFAPPHIMAQIREFQARPNSHLPARDAPKD